MTSSREFVRNFHGKDWWEKVTLSGFRKFEFSNGAYTSNFPIEFTRKMMSRFSQNLYSEAISKLRFGDSTTAPFRRYASLFCCLTLAEGCYYSKLLRSLAKPFLAFAWPRKDCMASQSIAFPRKTFARKRKDCEVMQYLCVPSQTFAWPRNRKNIFLMSSQYRRTKQPSEQKRNLG